jgi:hypothetical protein
MTWIVLRGAELRELFTVGIDGGPRKRPLVAVSTAERVTAASV